MRRSRPASAPPAAAHTVAATETEFKIALAEPKVPPGKITFAVKNAGKIQHDLVVSGPGVTSTAKTPLLDPGAVREGHRHASRRAATRCTAASPAIARPAWSQAHRRLTLERGKPAEGGRSGLSGEGAGEGGNPAYRSSASGRASPSRERGISHERRKEGAITCRAVRRSGRVAEGGALLRRYGDECLHRGFESLLLR